MQITILNTGGILTRVSGMTRLILCWIAVLALAQCWSARAVESRVFDVSQFGAKGDGKTLDTVAIQKALDECGKAGGGTVRFKPGAYLSKPLTLHSETTVEVQAGAVLQATDAREDFVDSTREGGNSFVPFIVGRELTNIVFCGRGSIDGAGARWWEPAEAARRKTPGYTMPRPRLIQLNDCVNVRVQDLTLQNSPTFHFVPMRCENVVVSNVTILAPSTSPNTDAIDPSATRHMLITHCLIDVGDDNVAIKAGHPIEGRAAATDDITVTDCTFRHGHGMSIGSETAGGVRNVTVRRCTFVDTENGLRIKSPRGKGGLIENIVYSDISMKDVTAALTITCYYPHIPEKDEAKPMTPETPAFRNITVSNLTATTSRDAGVIVGLPESAVTNVVLENVKISASDKGLMIRNASGVRFRDVKVTAQNGPAFDVKDAQVEGLPPGPGQ